MLKISKFTKTLVSAAVLPSIMAVAFMVSGVPGMVEVAVAKDKKDLKFADRKTRRTPALSEKIYKVLGKAQECADLNDYVCAMQVLEDGLGYKLQKLNSYERAQYHNFRGFLNYSQEKYSDAIVDYRNVLSQENLPAAMEDTVTYTLGQLYFIQEDFQTSIDLLLKWLQYQPEPTAQPLIFIGQAYYSLGSKENVSKKFSRDNYSKGIPYIEKAIGLYEAKGKEPKENWYLLLRVMYFELQENQKVVDILELLVKRWPKKDYWLQLAGMYGEMASDKGKSERQKKTLEIKQLATYEAAFRQGFLEKSSELVNMSQLYLYHETPYRASKVLKTGLANKSVENKRRNWESLSQAHINAQDYKQALSPLRKAAEMADTGKLYLRLGQVYMQLDDYKNAAKYIGKALEKGGLKRPDSANVVQGMAYFNRGQLDKARRSFEAAAKYKRSKKMAKKWISYLAREKKRLADIKEFLG